MVFGIRSERQSPLARKLITLISRFTIKIFYWSPATDVNVPYRLMRTESVLPLINTVATDTFAPNLIISGFLGLFFLGFTEVPVSCRERQTGVVSIRKWRLLKAAFKALWQTILARFNYSAQRPRWLATFSRFPEILQRRPWIAYAIVFLMAIFQVLRIDLSKDWWFEDDTVNLSYVASHTSIFNYFHDSSFLSPPGMGTQPLPFQYVSYWIDRHFGQLDAFWAYTHTSLLFIITALLLFAALSRVLKPINAIGGTILWMLIPSTIVVVEYLSVRHYLYGFTFLLSALLFANKATEKNVPRKRSISYYALAAICVFASMLCKQIYVTAALPVVFMLYLYRRSIIGIISTVVLAPLYIGYVSWLTGLNYEYSSQTVAPSQSIDFLKALVTTVTNSDFYLLAFGVMLFLTPLIAYNRKGFTRSQAYLLFTFAAVTFLAVVTCYSVSLPIVNSYQAPGTWYRAVFFFASFSILSWAIWCDRFLPKSLASSAIFLTAIYLVPKSSQAIHYWNNMKMAYKQEGQFVLEHSNALLYSELPAYWYFQGLKDLYSLNEKRWILGVLGEKPDTAKTQDIWIMHEHKIVPIQNMSATRYSGSNGY
jgi:hypothetical protein